MFSVPDAHKNYLVSYAYGNEMFDFLNKHCIHLFGEMNLILDSGAYTAWKSGREIRVEDYISFYEVRVKSCKFRELYVVNLDKIPARPGVREVNDIRMQEAATTSAANAKKLRGAGISDVIEVFHQGEKIDPYLYKMIASQGEPYIGVSPANDAYPTSRLRWLDSVFSEIGKRYGPDRVRTHGFGVTAYSLIAPFPWTSVDSASFAILAGYGTVTVFDDSLDPPKFHRFYLGSKPSAVTQRQLLTQSWDRFKPFMPPSFSSIEELSSSSARTIFNAYAYQRCESHINKIRKSQELPRLRQKYLEV